jgi:hypothetical protein
MTFAPFFTMSCIAVVPGMLSVKGSTLCDSVRSSQL